MVSFGPNLGYVDELYARYLEDPGSVSEAWRDFFSDLPVTPPVTEAVPVTEHAAQREPAPDTGPAAAAEPASVRGTAPGSAGAPEGAEPIRGAAARIVENMTASLGIPTATSVRTLPVKLLEENRLAINHAQSVRGGRKVSFTHLIAWAIVRALEKHPALNGSFVAQDGASYRLPRSAVNLGIAIDVERRGEKSLLVPSIKGAGAIDFRSFCDAYDDLVTRARQGKLSPDDLAGTTVTLTNPGMLGTSLSVPRLMSGQGAIFGAGAIAYPPQYAGVAPEVISELGISKVMTLTSTYDHRIVQGAESGAFLSTVERLLLGEEAFYDRVFADLGIPQEPARWSPDRNPRVLGGATQEAIEKQARVVQLMRSYRVRGHLWADVDPLAFDPEPHPELELSYYGLSLWDLDRRFVALTLGGATETRTLREILETLRETYCRHVGVEYMHIPEPEVRLWLQERMERTRNAEPLSREVKLRVLEKLNAAEAFERFLHSTYVGHKRFSLEGAETLVPVLDVLFNDAVSAGIEEAVIGMAHRGRLNVLANVIGKSYTQIFREFEGIVDPESTQGSGDVKYHLGASGTHHAPDGRTLRLTLSSNPSHLEAVDPVVEGMARGKQDLMGDASGDHVLPVLIHGDAAFAGQGVVAETLNLSQLPGYRTGGTVHIVVNNQIGFTTGPEQARSSFYATDVAKMVRAPIFHVNGDHPEDAVRAVRLALAFRQALKRDVVVDLVCYRRWGHNEGDDPSYTHPILYAKIEKHRSVRKLYTAELLRRGDLAADEAEQALLDFQRRLQGAFDEIERAAVDEPPPRADLEEALATAGSQTLTAIGRDVLEDVLQGLDRVPDGFEIHPKLAIQLGKRRERFAADKIDWGLAESLAYGSIAIEGIAVRLSGQDSGRGTFSQRHAILYDHRTAAPWVPLASLREGQAPFRVWDSLLSEMAVLGFEYGYSAAAPDALVLWEAQFGDFGNGAQTIIDQFISSAEEKWGQKSRLVLLLPHGYEGQGPEHSSARLERFLQLAARGNMQIAIPTTPAQVFHLLRRQARLASRKPLVVMTPKSLLRHPDATSSAAELAEGSFAPVLDDARVPPEEAKRLVLCAGKVYYDLLAHRRESGVSGVALVRLEQLYPYPAEQILAILDRYARVRDVVWAQEEPRNMGAFAYLDHRLGSSLAPRQTLRYVGRPGNASPATGSYKRHLAEQAVIVREALGPPRS